MHTEARTYVAIPDPESSTNIDDDDDDDRKHGFDDLPECLQRKILACLPLKSVFVFKSVSKRWNSFISTQDFSTSYVAAKERFSINRTLLLLRISVKDDPWLLISAPTNHDDRERARAYSTMDQRLSSSSTNDNEKPFTMLDFPFPAMQPDQIGGVPCTVLSACNGLLLCRNWDAIYGICNPITRQWIVLPEFKEHCTHYSFMRIAFVAKVDKSSSKLISYRVVFLIVGELLLNKLRMEIYDSDTNEWTKSEVQLPGGYFLIAAVPLQPTYLNEIIHWEFERDGVDYAVAVDPYKHGQHQCRPIVLPSTSTLSVQAASL